MFIGTAPTPRERANTEARSSCSVRTAHSLARVGVLAKGPSNVERIGFTLNGVLPSA